MPPHRYRAHLASIILAIGLATLGSMDVAASASAYSPKDSGHARALQACDNCAAWADAVSVFCAEGIHYAYSVDYGASYSGACGSPPTCAFIANCNNVATVTISTYYGYYLNGPDASCITATPVVNSASIDKCGTSDYRYYTIHSDTP